MFDFNPLEPGNFSTLGCWENDQELKVKELVNKYSYRSISVDLLEAEMDSRGIDYANLPPYLQNEIDRIDVY